METLQATNRSNTSSGQVKKLRSDGFIPGILYGGSENNKNISVKKILLKKIINTDSFMSSVFNMDIDGKHEKVLPREVAYDPVTDEPIHIDFIRIVKGSKLALEIPVKFINNEKSPGLKKGGVLNIVRRKVELKCPSENIPSEIVIDLENKEIGTSIKISSVNLPENVFPTITDRDFVIATVAAPTIVVEPAKPAEATEEGEVSIEGEGEVKTEGDGEKTDDKTKAAKAPDEKNAESSKVTTNKESSKKK